MAKSRKMMCNCSKKSCSSCSMKVRSKSRRASRHRSDGKKRRTHRVRRRRRSDDGKKRRTRRLRRKRSDGRSKRRSFSA